MRARIAKRLRKKALRKGLSITREGLLRSGVYIEGLYKNNYVLGVGKDRLKAYRDLLLDMEDVK